MKIKNIIIAITLITSSALTVQVEAGTNRDTAVAGFSGGAGLIIGGAAATGVGVPVAGAIAAGAGGFQMGWFTMCFLFDPPDLVNYATPVDLNDFLVYTFPDMLSVEPTLDATVAASFDTHMNDLDYGIALNRAYRASLDREAGAIQVGDLVNAAARRSEAENFASQLPETVAQARSSLDGVITSLDAFNSGILDLEFSMSDFIAIRDDLASESLPSFEDIAVTSWAITEDELNGLFNGVGALTDEDLENVFLGINPQHNGSVTLRELFIASGDSVASSHVPTPPTLWLFGSGLISFFGMRKRLSKVSTLPA